MTTERRDKKAIGRWSKLEEKRAGSIGPGFQQNPDKGTRNPFTSQLKSSSQKPDKQPRDQ